MVTLIFCLNCHKKIPRSEAYVDRIGQFTKLNLKAMELGKQDVEICYDCYEKLTDKSGPLRGSGVFGIS